MYSFYARGKIACTKLFGAKIEEEFMKYICNTCGVSDLAPENEDFGEIEDMYGMCQNCFDGFINDNPVMRAYDESYCA